MVTSYFYLLSTTFLLVSLIFPISLIIDRTLQVSFEFVSRYFWQPIFFNFVQLWRIVCRRQFNVNICLHHPHFTYIPMNGTLIILCNRNSVLSSFNHLYLKFLYFQISRYIVIYLQRHLVYRWWKNKSLFLSF